MVRYKVYRGVQCTYRKEPRFSVIGSDCCAPCSNHHHQSQHRQLVDVVVTKLLCICIAQWIDAELRAVTSPSTTFVVVR